MGTRAATASNVWIVGCCWFYICLLSKSDCAHNGYNEMRWVSATAKAFISTCTLLS